MRVSERLLTSVLPAGNKRKGMPWCASCRLTAPHPAPEAALSRPAGGILARVSIVPVPLRRPVVARDTDEPHRAATPLELLFDLVFVVAIASNAAELHHGLADAHYATVVGYSMTWFAIWWAWMNYTWFASAYDNDDVVFRLLTFVIMVGALFLAAGVPDIFADGQSTTVVLGYAIMRFAMVGLWLRAAAGHPEGRQTALWYAGGITVVQLLWIARLGVPEAWLHPLVLPARRARAARAACSPSSGTATRRSTRTTSPSATGC